MLVPSATSMSIPFLNVLVPNLGCTCAPYSPTTLPSAGQASRPRRPANPTHPARCRSEAPCRDRAGAGGALAIPALLFLQVPDERLEPLGRLGQLPDHPVVIRPLVLDRARSTCRLATSRSASARSSSASDRRPVSSFCRASNRDLSVGQALRSHTILSNQSSVHRRQGREVPELNRLRRAGSSPESSSGQHAALGLELVERPGAGARAPPPGRAAAARAC